MPEVVRVLVHLVLFAGLFAALLASLSAWALIGQALWPRHVQSVRIMLEETGSRALLLGFLDVVALLGIAALLHRPPLALLCIGVLVGLALSGLPALAGLLGDRVRRMLGTEPSPGRSAVLGVCLLGLAALLPVAGWVLAGGLLLAALGAASLAVAGSLRAEAAPRSREGA